MKKEEVFEIEDAKVRCFLVSCNPCGPDEYEVDIVVGNHTYRIYTFVGLFEREKSVCDRVYSEWKNGYHKDVIAEVN